MEKSELGEKQRYELHELEEASEGLYAEVVTADGETSWWPLYYQCWEVSKGGSLEIYTKGDGPHSPAALSPSWWRTVKTVHLGGAKSETSDPTDPSFGWWEAQLTRIIAQSESMVDLIDKALLLSQEGHKDVLVLRARRDDHKNIVLLLTNMLKDAKGYQLTE